MTKPQRSASKGMEARSGSLLSQSAIELVNPAMASGQTVASLPPARMASA